PLPPPPARPSARRPVSLSPPRPPRRSALFPYTTLFRSLRGVRHGSGGEPVPDAAPRAGEGSSAAARVPSVAEPAAHDPRAHRSRDRKSTRLNSSHVKISYAVFCLKKKTDHLRTANDSSH